jgi:hypothetical protein
MPDERESRGKRGSLCIDRGVRKNSYSHGSND